MEVTGSSILGDNMASFSEAGVPPRPTLDHDGMLVDSRVLHARLEEVDVRVEQQGDAVSALRDHVASVSGRQDAADARHDAATAALSHHGRRLNHVGTSVVAQQRRLVAVEESQEASTVAIRQQQRVIVVRVGALERPQAEKGIREPAAHEPPFPSFMQPESEVFVGHRDVLDRLAASLGRGVGAGAGTGAGAADDGQVTVISQAISGLGGVGKSAIARQLCRRVRRLRRYRRGIFWLLGESTSALQKGYHDMASQLALDVDPATANADRDAVFAWMRSCDGWLLVVDNVDEPEAVTAFMPPRDARGNIVVTT